LRNERHYEPREKQRRSRRKSPLSPKKDYQRSRRDRWRPEQLKVGFYRHAG